MLFNIVAHIAQFDLVNSGTCPMKFKDFQAPVLFSSTFKALNLGEKNSSTFKDFQGCVGTMMIRCLSACQQPLQQPTSAQAKCCSVHESVQLQLVAPTTAVVRHNQVQDVVYDFKAQLQGTESRSERLYEES